MEDMVTLEIDGKKVEVKQGATILDAAREAGIDIPTLCVYKDLLPYGGCRVCSVEIQKGSRTKVVASCGYPAEQDLKVITRSPKIDKIRRTLVELVAPQAMFEGEVSGDLRKLADTYGADIHRYEDRLGVKSTRCILCGLCVRYCNEVLGAPALGFVGRGIERRVVFFPEKARNAFSAGMEWATEICPTGKIGAEADNTYFGFTVEDFLAGKL